MTTTDAAQYEQRIRAAFIEQTLDIVGPHPAECSRYSRGATDADCDCPLGTALDAYRTAIEAPFKARLEEAEARIVHVGAMYDEASGQRDAADRAARRAIERAETAEQALGEARLDVAKLKAALVEAFIPLAVLAQDRRERGPIVEIAPSTYTSIDAAVALIRSLIETPTLQSSPETDPATVEGKAE